MQHSYGTTQADATQKFFVVVGHPRFYVLAAQIEKKFPAAVIYGGNGAGQWQPWVGGSLFSTIGYLYQLATADGTPLLALVNGGLVMRALAPMIGGQDKWASPPLLLVASDNKTLYPLLGEHHGGRDLGLMLAAGVGLSYAGTVEKNADDLPHHFYLAGRELLPRWLRDGKPIKQDWRWQGADDGKTARGPTHSLPTQPPAAPQIIPPCLAVGIGLERDAPLAAVESLLTESLAVIGAHPRAVMGIASIDIKMDEPALHQLAAARGLPLKFFSASSLATVAVPNPSARVMAEVGTPSVAEAAALLLATTVNGNSEDGVAQDDNLAQQYKKNGGKKNNSAPTLILEKKIAAGVTIAIAECATTSDRLSGVMTGLTTGVNMGANMGANMGITLGSLAVVGLGPGDRLLRPAATNQHIAAATDVVGYQLYLDLAEDMLAGKNIHARDLGAERERTALAIDLALQGRRVVLLGSGDAGIYALASLVWQLLDEMRQDNNMPPRQKLLARALPITVVPGISAFQALAARLGAPAGNDLAMVSLSDLMTPREKIIQRITGAIAGDFVLFLYNPRSRTREQVFIDCLQLLRAARPPATPLAVGKNLYRPNEEIIHTTLGQLQVEQVDMFSCLMVGNSSLRTFTHLGRKIYYAPRGY